MHYYNGWTDQRTRSLMNFIIHCPKGTIFLKSLDASAESHTADFLLKEICKVIDYVGEENVVQVIFAIFSSLFSYLIYKNNFILFYLYD